MVRVRDLRPEDQLVLCCSRTDRGPDGDAWLGELIPRIEDWQYVIRLAERHAVMPLLCWNLKSAAVPATIADRLREYNFRHTAGTLLLVSELVRLLTLLQARGIRAVPFKGPSLAALAYGNPALRATGDLDILIKPADVLRAKSTLLDAGYTPRRAFSAAEEADVLRYHHQYGFVGSQGRVLVELQWGITRSHLSSPVDGDSLWDRLQRVPLGGGIVDSLGSDDLLLLLCAHGTKHCWSELRWICDIAELIRRSPNMDLEALLGQARARGGERMLLLGIRLASELLDLRVPENIAARAADDRVTSLVESVGQRLFGDEGPGDAESRVETLIFNLRARERMREKLRSVRLLAEPSAGDEEILRAAPALRALRYAIRPFRLVWKYGRAPLARLTARRRGPQ